MRGMQIPGGAVHNMLNFGNEMDFQCIGKAPTTCLPTYFSSPETCMTYSLSSSHPSTNHPAPASKRYIKSNNVENTGGRECHS